MSEIAGQKPDGEGPAAANLLALTGTLDQLRAGVIVLDRRRTICHSNESADEVLALRDPLLRVDGVILPARDEYRDRFRSIILDSTEWSGEMPPARLMLLPRQAGKGTLQVLVLPLSDRMLSRSLGAALLLTDPELGFLPNPELLRSLYNLTNAETRLAIELVYGSTIQEAAKTLLVSITTARSHLQRIFAKTGTSRQPELLRLLTSAMGGLRLDRHRVERIPLERDEG